MFNVRMPLLWFLYHMVFQLGLRTQERNHEWHGQFDPPPRLILLGLKDSYYPFGWEADLSKQKRKQGRIVHKGALKCEIISKVRYDSPMKFFFFLQKIHRTFG